MRDQRAQRLHTNRTDDGSLHTIAHRYDLTNTLLILIVHARAVRLLFVSSSTCISCRQQGVNRLPHERPREQIYPSMKLIARSSNPKSVARKRTQCRASWLQFESTNKFRTSRQPAQEETVRLTTKDDSLKIRSIISSFNDVRRNAVTRSLAVTQYTEHARRQTKQWLCATEVLTPAIDPVC